MKTSDYSYRESHINCGNCQKNQASSFMIESWIDSNYEQSMEINKMKDPVIVRDEKAFEDAKGKGSQICYSTNGYTTPWFAANPSKIPVLVPVCEDCKQSFEITYETINQIGKFIANISNMSFINYDLRFINDSHAFRLYKLQQRRFGTGSPHYPWIDCDGELTLKEIS